MSVSVDPEIHTGLLVHFARYYDACDRADIDEVMQIMAGATISVGAQTLSNPDWNEGRTAGRRTAVDHGPV